MPEFTDNVSAHTRLGAVPTPPWSTEYRYSPAVMFGSLVFVSGQVGVDGAGEPVGPDFLDQAHQAFANVSCVLEQAGSRLDCVLRVTLFLVNQQDFDHVPALRARYFSIPYPADTTVVVRSLARPGLLFEMDAIAHRL